MRIMIVAIALAVGGGTGLAAPSASRPSLSVSAAVGVEGGRAVFAVRLAKPAAERVTVRYATQDLSARAGLDYTRRAGTLTFHKGQTSNRIVIRLLDDAQPEASETFTVRLSRASNARPARASARGTIRANDLPSPFTTVAEMTGNQNATATATLTFDAENASLRSTVSARGLSGFVHLHRGSAGAEGPLLASLVGPSDNGTGTGTAPLSRAVILQIHVAPADFYVELHTRSGAFRGQLRRID